MTHVSAQRTVRSLNHTSTTYNKPRIGFSYAVQTRAWLATANLSGTGCLRYDAKKKRYFI